MLISSIFQTKEDGGQMDSELRVRTTYVSGSGIGIHFTLRIQSPRKKFVCGCEKFHTFFGSPVHIRISLAGWHYVKRIVFWQNHGTLETFAICFRVAKPAPQVPRNAPEDGEKRHCIICIGCVCVCVSVCLPVNIQYVSIQKFAKKKNVLIIDHPYFLKSIKKATSFPTRHYSFMCFALRKASGSLLCVTSWLRRTVPISITL